MDYAASRDSLLQEFSRRGFMDALGGGQFLKWEYEVETLESGTVVTVVFPGLKSRIRPHTTNTGWTSQSRASGQRCLTPTLCSTSTTNAAVV